MKIYNKFLSFSVIFTLCVTLLTGCRIPQEDTEDDGDVAVLYRTYCEDSYGNYSVDNEAALTFYSDDTYRIGHVSGLVPGQPTSTYTYHYGTRKIENGTLSLTNSEGAAVGNGDDNIDRSDRETWSSWGVSNYVNSDGTVTKYASLYAFEETDSGFVLDMLDANYFYWGASEHLETIYSNAFDEVEFLAAYNEANGTRLDSLDYSWGSAAPVEWYEWDSSNTVFADPDFVLPSFG
ncbi:MAG: hypothetical protein LUG61_03185 [Lachnospiraceae bacterium]|nr:hypothetical protein [Lachnospiraceae bacterium]